MAVQGPSRRRSGISIAAGALALTLIGGVVVPVSLPSALPVASAAVPGAAGWASPNLFTAPTFAPDGDIRHGAHESPGTPGAQHTVSGTASYAPSGRNDDQTVPLEGVRIYAQYFEMKGTQTASPVYTTLTDANGEFTIEMQEFTSPNGKFQFDAFATSGNNTQESYRVWAQNPDTGALQLLDATNNGWVVSDTTAAGLAAGDTNISGFEFVFGNAIDIDATQGLKYNSPAGDSVTGNLSWDFGTATLPAAGDQVFASYLSDAAVEHVEANGAAGIGYAGTVRDAQWTIEHEQQLQLWIRGQMEDSAVSADWPEVNDLNGEEPAYVKWLGETSQAVTDAQGNYSIGFDREPTLDWVSVVAYNERGAELAQVTPFFNNGFYSAQALNDAGWLTCDAGTQQLNGVDFSFYPEHIGLAVGEGRRATATGVPFIPGVTYEFEWRNANGQELAVTVEEPNRSGTMSSFTDATAAAATGYTVTLVAVVDGVRVDLAKTGADALVTPGDGTTGSAVALPEIIAPAEPVQVAPGEATTITLDTTNEVPGTYTLVDAPTWATIDPTTGEITITPDENGPFGDETLDVRFTAADGTTTEDVAIPLHGTVEEPQISWPESDTAEVVVGTREPVTIEAQVDNTTYGEYSLVDAPEWATIDPATGDITVQPPAGTEYGEMTLDVLFSGRDGSTSEHQVGIYVKPARPTLAWPEANSHISIGEAVTVPSPVDSLPARAYFTESADTPSWVSANLDGSVHVAPTAAQAGQLQPGQTVDIPITYVAEDHVTTYDYTLTLTVDETGPLAEKYRPHYRDVRFTAGSEATSGAPLADIEATTGVESSALPEGTTFSTITAGAHIDENTGVVTFTAPTGSTETRFAVDVQVTYPDETSDIATVTFIKDSAKMADLYTPGYTADYAVVPGGSVTIEQDREDYAPILGPDGEPAALQPLPEFTLPARSNDFGEWSATINRETGEVTVFAPYNASEPKQVTVRVTYADGSYRDMKFDIAVLDGDSDAATSTPSYELIPVLPGDDFTFEQTGGVPAGTRFYLTATGGLPVTVDHATGTVSGTMPADAAAGAGYGFQVEIAHPDGTSEQLSLELPLAKLSDLSDPEVADTKLSRGDRMTTAPLSTHLPNGTEFGLLATYSVPEGWAVYVDPSTGAVTVEADNTVPEGETIEVPVVVNYPDGTQDLTHATVQATRNAGESLGVSYPTVKLRAGQRATVAPVQQHDGAVYSLGEGMPNGFAAVLNPATGAITIDAHETTLPGTYSIPVSVRFADQSVKQTQVLVDTLTVEGYSALAEAEKMPVVDHVLAPGTTAELALVAPDASEVAEFTLQGEPVWNARVNQDNNTLHVDVPSNAEPGEQVTFDVAARYADGSERNVPLTVEVDYPYETVGDSPFSPLLVLASVFAGMGAVAGLIYFLMNFFGLNLPQLPGGSSIG